MKRGFWVLLTAMSLAACNGGTTITVKENAAGRELDTLGEKIEERATVVGDSVKAAYKGIKERVKAKIDSIRADQKIKRD